MTEEARLAPSIATPRPRSLDDPTLPLATAAFLAAVLVGVALAADVSVGIGLLIGLCYVPLVLVNLKLGLTLWIPLTFLTGIPALNLGADAAGMLIVVAWLGVLRSSSDEVIAIVNRHRRLLLALAGLLVWLTLSMLWADDPGLVAVDLWPPLYALVVVFVVVITVVDTPRALNLAALAFVAGAALSASIGIFDGSLTSAVDGAARVEGGSGDPNFLASSIVAAVVLAGGLLAGSRSPILRLGLALAIVVLIAGLIGSASRGGVLAAGAAIVVAVFVFRGRRTHVMASVAVIATLAAFALVSAPAIWERVTDFDEDNGRSDLWYVAWEMGKDNPVAGVGLNNFRLHIPDYVTAPGGIEDAGNLVDQPHFVHNTYLQMWVEGGIVALALFLGVVVACLRAAREAAVRFARSGRRSLETLAQAVVVATISMLVAAIFLSAALDASLWLLLALGPALLTVAQRGDPSGVGESGHLAQDRVAESSRRPRLVGA